jgi:predicted DNA-binding protein
MTTINIPIPSELHKELKILSVQEDKPLKECVVELLEQYLSKEVGK